MNDKVDIKPATLKELDILTQLAYQTFYDTFAHLNKPDDFNNYMEKAFSSEQMKAELNNPGSEFYFLYYQSSLAGYLKLNTGKAQTDLQDPESLEIERIYISKAYQGLGLGKALFELSLKRATEQNLSYIWLGVWEQNTKAVEFYKSRGFYKFAEHPFKLGSDLQTDNLMRLDL